MVAVVTVAVAQVLDAFSNPLTKTRLYTCKLLNNCRFARLLHSLITSIGALKWLCTVWAQDKPCWCQSITMISNIPSIPMGDTAIFRPKFSVMLILRQRTSIYFWKYGWKILFKQPKYGLKLLACQHKLVSWQLCSKMNRIPSVRNHERYGFIYSKILNTSSMFQCWLVT